MALDPNIIMQLQQYQAPDFAGAQQRAMQVGSMMQQRQMMDTYRQAQVEQIRAQAAERGIKLSAEKERALAEKGLVEFFERKRLAGQQIPSADQQGVAAGRTGPGFGPMLDGVQQGRTGPGFGPMLSRSEPEHVYPGPDRREAIAAMPSAGQGVGGYVPQAGDGTRVRTLNLPQQQPGMQPQQPQMQPQPQQQQQMQQGGLPPEIVMQMAKIGYKPEQIEQIANAHRLGQAKQKGTVEFAGPNGEPMIAQTDEYGQIIGKPMPKAVAMQMMDRGGSQQAWNQYTGQAGPSYDKTATPDALMTDARGRESNRISAGQLGVAQGNLGVAKGNLAVNQGRLQLDRDSPKMIPMDTSQGPVFANPRTQQVFPAMMDGKPVPPKEGESQKKLRLDIDNSIQQTTEALAALEKHPDAFGVMLGTAASKGGALGADLVNKRIGPEAAAARAFVMSKGGAMAHELLGAAQTPSEQARVKSFIPQDTDSAQTLKNKFNGLMKEYRIKQGVYGGGQPSAPSGGNVSLEDALKKYGN